MQFHCSSMNMNLLSLILLLAIVGVSVSQQNNRFLCFDKPAPECHRELSVVALFVEIGLPIHKHEKCDFILNECEIIREKCTNIPRSEVEWICPPANGTATPKDGGPWTNETTIPQAPAGNGTATPIGAPTGNGTATPQTGGPSGNATITPNNGTETANSTVPILQGPVPPPVAVLVDAYTVSRKCQLLLVEGTRSYEYEMMLRYQGKVDNITHFCWILNYELFVKQASAEIKQKCGAFDMGNFEKRLKESKAHYQCHKYGTLPF